MAKENNKDFFSFEKNDVNFKDHFDKATAVDCMVFQIASKKTFNTEYIREFDMLKMNEFMEFITQGMSYDVLHAGFHINYWTCEKIINGLEKSGFSKIIKSRRNASVFPEMQNQYYFDKTAPYLSLYIEALKS